jgi:protocatechuate 3,4-dioxygenase beta subunit
LITLKPGGAELSGSVVDATGGIVVGALVTVEPPPPGEKFSAPDESARLRGATMSDWSGAFRLRVPREPLVVSAQADGYSRASLRLSPPFPDVTLALVPGSEIVGSVRMMETQEAVSNVSVVALGKSGPSREPSHVETDADGEFSLRGLAAGAYEITAASTNFRSLPSLVSIGMGERSEPVSIFVEKAFTLSGSVFVDGELCHRGVLSASGSRSSSAPIVAGQVANVSMLGGHYDITIECDGAVPQRESIELWKDEAERIWSLSPGISVQGRVETAAGKPLAGANVGVSSLHSMGGGSLCVTDAAGEFSCGGLTPGEHRCSLSDAYGNETHSVNVTVAALSTPRVVLRASSAGTIRGRIEGSKEGHLRVYAFRSGWSPVEAVPDAGRFEFKGLALGRYVVSATRPQEDRGVEDVTVSLERDGEIVDVELRAPVWFTIKGRVVDERGTPVMDAWMHASLPVELGGDRYDSSPAVLTDERGGFTLERLASGEYDIIASTDRGQTILRGAQSGDANVLVKLTGYGELSGVVSTSTGDIVSSFELWYQRGSKLSRDRYHSDDGSWSLPWLPAGEYRVGIHSEHGDAAADVVLNPGGRTNVTLTVAPLR